MILYRKALIALNGYLEYANSRRNLKSQNKEMEESGR